MKRLSFFGNSLHKAEKILVNIRLLNSICYFMLFPIATIILIEHKHFNALQTASLMSYYIFANKGMTFINGYLCSFFDDKKIMIIARLTGSVGYLILSFSQNYYWMALGFILVGTSSSMYHVSSVSYLTNSINEKNCVELFAIIGTMVNIGASIGPAIGSLVLKKVGEDWIFGMSSLSYFLTSLLIVFLIPPLSKKSLRKNNSSTLKLFTFIGDRSLIKVILIGYFGEIIFNQFFIIFPVFYNNNAKVHIDLSFFFTLSAVLCVFFQYRLSKRFKSKLERFPYYSISLLFLMTGSSFLILSFGAFNLSVFVFVIFYTLGEMLFYPITGPLITSISAPHMRSYYFGVFGLFSSLGATTANILLTVYDYFNKNEMGNLYWYIPVFITVVAVLLAFLFHNIESSRNKIVSC